MRWACRVWHLCVCVFFLKIAVRPDSPYIQQISFTRKMPINAIACGTSIRRFKKADYQLIDPLNFVQIIFLERKKSTRDRTTGAMREFAADINSLKHMLALEFL
jgi:hypothetical protein